MDYKLHGSSIKEQVADLISKMRTSSLSGTDLSIIIPIENSFLNEFVSEIKKEMLDDKKLKKKNIANITNYIASIQELVEKSHLNEESSNIIQNITLIAKELLNAQKRRKLTKILLYSLTGIVIATGISSIIFKEQILSRYAGMNPIQDEIVIEQDSFNLANITACAAIGMPISNIEDFMLALQNNIQDAKDNNKQMLQIPSIYTLFSIGSSEITEESAKLLDCFVDALNQTNKQSNIVIEGYGCNLGSIAGNDYVSKKRAEITRDYLINRGIPANNIEIEWYGKNRNSEFNYESLAEYRRVTISIK